MDLKLLPKKEGTRSFPNRGQAPFFLEKGYSLFVYLGTILA